MKTIPLDPGYADPRFSVTIKGVSFVFDLKWSTQHKYYSVNIYRSPKEAVALGRALHVGVDLLAGLNLGYGKIILEGRRPTVRNLGVDNKLRWYANE